MGVFQRILQTLAGISAAGFSQPCTQGKDTEEPGQHQAHQQAQRPGSQQDETQWPFELYPQEIQVNRVRIERTDHQSQRDGQDRNEDEREPVQEPISS